VARGAGRYGGDLPGVAAEAPQYLSGGDIPKPGHVVVAPGQGMPAVGAEGDGAEPTVVAGKGPDLSGSANIPEPYRHHAAEEGIAAVRTDRRRRNPFSGKRLYLPSRGEIPHFGAVLVISGDDMPTVGTHGQGLDPAAAVIEGPKPPTVGGIQNEHNGAGALGVGPRSIRHLHLGMGAHAGNDKPAVRTEDHGGKTGVSVLRVVRKSP